LSLELPNGRKYLAGPILLILLVVIILISNTTVLLSNAQLLLFNAPAVPLQPPPKILSRALCSQTKPLIGPFTRFSYVLLQDHLTEFPDYPSIASSPPQ
jgi:hypothetical protein